MIDILHHWNRWGNNSLDPGQLRQVTASVCRFIEVSEIVALIGLRRSGKTTVLYQVMSALEGQGVDPKAMLYINFEDPGFSQLLTPQLLDELYRTYREKVFPQGKAYLFLDEIQVVPEWERWVSARNQTENIKIFVSGSSAALMSRELATVLTGRNIAIHIHPFSFREYLAVQHIELPSLVPNNAPALIQAALNEYVSWGGLPRVALEKDKIIKRSLLSNYLDNILFKDVALRHQIRNPRVLQNLAVHLLTQTSNPVSYHRLAELFQSSQEMMQLYCGYLQECFLVEFLPYHSLKVAERNRNPHKIHVHDLGFRTIAAISASPDEGKRMETLVHNTLKRDDQQQLFYSKNPAEVDLLVQQGTQVTQLIQVCYEGLDHAKTFQREVGALKAMQERYPKAQKLIITHRMPASFAEKLPSFIEVVPLWKFLLNH